MRYSLIAHIYAYTILFLCTMLAFADESSSKANKEQTGNPYSKEQKLLFSTPHLTNIKTKAALYYDFHQHGSKTRNFDDEIILTITGISENGGKDLEISFLSGENNRAYSNIRDFRSNPLLMFFLQWDVEKMDSGSKITHHYFRHLLRQAFLDDIESEEIKIDFEGHSVAANKIFFQPLSKQQGDAHYENYPQKYYEFVLSDAIPGGIYSISTLMASGSDAEKDDTSSAEPLESTLIRFNRIDMVEQ